MCAVRLFYAGGRRRSRHSGLNQGEVFLHHAQVFIVGHLGFSGQKLLLIDHVGDVNAHVEQDVKFRIGKIIHELC